MSETPRDLHAIEGSASRRPIVSAMMPTHNAAVYLEEAIGSILGQTLDDWELVIVDDGSSDGTKEILRTWATDPRIHIFRLPENRGRGFARNYALEHCRGKYVAICDSDDVSLPDRFEVQVQFLEKHQEVGVVASQVLQFADGEAPTVRVVQPETDSAIRGRMQRGKSPIPNQSAMIRRELFERFGGYAVDFRRCQDVDFFLRVRDATRFHTLHQPLVLYRQTRRGPSLKYWLANAFYEMYAFARAKARDTGHPPPSLEEFQKKFSTLARLWLREPAAFGFFRLRRLFLKRVVTRS